MNIKKSLYAVVFAGLAAGCAALSPDLPSITDSPTGDRHAGRVVWHDLLTNTPEQSRRFYSEIFGWEFEAPGIDLGIGDNDAYMLIRHQGRLIGGMVDANALRRDVNISQWMTVISVDDIDTAVAQVRADGGEVLTEPTVLPSRGVLAVAAGPEGALFALIQAKDGDPPERQPAHNEWLWNELWTSDVDRSTAFYGALFGLQSEDREFDGTDRGYRVLNGGGVPRAGILDNPFDGAPSVWVNYVRVEDPTALAARVEELGGKVLVEPRRRDIGGEVAFIAGPSGAGIALQTWPLEQE